MKKNYSNVFAIITGVILVAMLIVGSTSASIPVNTIQVRQASGNSISGIADIGGTQYSFSAPLQMINDATTVPSATHTATVAPTGTSLPGYSLVFQDDFNTLNSVWHTGHWWSRPTDYSTTNTNEQQAYAAANVSVSNGALVITARKESAGGKSYTSGLVETGGDQYGYPTSFTFQYGYIEARIRIPSGQGLWPAFWMWPADYADPPELDIMEILGHQPGILYMATHYPGGTAEYNYSGADLSQEYHVYGCEWTPTSVVWYLDGVERARLTDPAKIPQEAMYLILNLAVGGDWPGPVSDSVLPATMQVDWVRVYQKPAVATSTNTPLPPATLTRTPTSTRTATPTRTRTNTPPPTMTLGPTFTPAPTGNVFSTGWWINGDRSTSTTVSTYAAQGNTLMLDTGWFTSLSQLSGRVALLNTAATNNVKLIVGLEGGATPTLSDADMTTVINTLKNLPALYAYYIGDEPEFTSNATERTRRAGVLLHYYQLIKQLDPSHPVFISFDFNSFAASRQWELEFMNCADIIGMHQYPFYTGTSNLTTSTMINNVWEAWKTLVSVANQYGKGYITTGQGFGVGYQSMRDPSYEELRFQAYSAIVLGSPAYLWWMDTAGTTNDRTLVNQLITEIKNARIAGIQNSLQQQAGVVVYRQVGNTIVAVNPTANTVTVSLPVTGSGADVLSENRSIVISNGSLSDVFTKFAVHIYILR